MYYIKKDEIVIGVYASYSEAKKAKLKLEAQDFINDDYVKGRYQLYYWRGEQK